jgi:putative salt-induced outer membrane protein
VLRWTCALFLAAFAATPAAATLPDPIRAMVENAFATNDAATIAAVVKVAKATSPADAGEIDALVGARQKRLDEQAALKRASTPFLKSIDGELEFGVTNVTGNTRSLGAYGSVKLTRNGPRWQHQLTARVDYLRTNGDTTTERASAAYEPKYKFDERLFAYGLAQYERDPILGYSSRYTAGGGIGYAIFNTPTLHIDLAGGPALRRTDFVDEPNKSTIAGRGSVAVRWRITPTMTFTQDGAIYIEEGGTNASLVSAIDTRLIGQLKARLSYDIKYERDAPNGNDPLDTVSRVTLLYSF